MLDSFSTVGSDLKALQDKIKLVNMECSAALAGTNYTVQHMKVQEHYLDLNHMPSQINKRNF